MNDTERQGFPTDRFDFVSGDFMPSTLPPFRARRTAHAGVSEEESRTYFYAFEFEYVRFYTLYRYSNTSLLLAGVDS
jgi:hypothetical protein